MDPARIRIVLLRTHHGKNLGAVARVLKNFGFTNLVLADVGAVDWSDVNQMAVRSTEVTERAPRVPDLATAIEGCRWVVGTTMRYRAGQRHLHPRAFAEQAKLRSAEGDVALVFGEERVGLTNEDLLQCHDVSVIPTTEALRSLNLAQAVLLYTWELFTVMGAPAATPPNPRAEEADYRSVERAIRLHMAKVGFQDPDRPRHGARDLVQTLKRAGLTPREAKLWEAVLTPKSR